MNLISYNQCKIRAESYFGMDDSYASTYWQANRQL